MAYPLGVYLRWPASGIRYSMDAFAQGTDRRIRDSPRVFSLLKMKALLAGQQMF